MIGTVGTSAIASPSTIASVRALSCASLPATRASWAVTLTRAAKSSTSSAVRSTATPGLPGTNGNWSIAASASAVTCSPPAARCSPALVSRSPSPAVTTAAPPSSSCLIETATTTAATSQTSTQTPSATSSVRMVRRIAATSLVAHVGARDVEVGVLRRVVHVDRILLRGQLAEVGVDGRLRPAVDDVLERPLRHGIEVCAAPRVDVRRVWARAAAVELDLDLHGAVARRAELDRAGDARVVLLLQVQGERVLERLLRLVEQLVGVRQAGVGQRGGCAGRILLLLVGPARRRQGHDRQTEHECLPHDFPPVSRLTGSSWPARAVGKPQRAATTGCISAPMPSISISTVSPSCSESGGSR